MRKLLLILALLWPAFGQAQDINIPFLANELATDPTGLGYTGDAEGDHEKINRLRTAIRIDRTLVGTWEIIEATVPAEWSALTAAEKGRYQMFISAGAVDLRGTNIRSAFAAMFGSGTTTRANLIALQTIDGSRAQVLFNGRSVPLHRIRIVLP